MLVRKDWLTRTIKQLAQFIAAAMGLAAVGKREEAVAMLRNSCGSLLGLDYGVLVMLDPKSAVDLLGETSRALIFVRLVEAMAKIEEPVRAEVRLRHGIELLEEILRRTPGQVEAAELRASLLARLAA